MMKVKTLVAAAATTLAISAAQADKVTLSSGSFLSGTAKAIEGDKLVFDSKDLGEMKIDISKIEVLESSGTHKVEFKDRTTKDLPVTIRGGALYVNDDKLDMSNVKSIDKGEETWHGSVHVTYESNRGNTYKNAASVMADVNRRWDEDRVKANFGYYYSEQGTSKDDKEKSTDRWEIEGQHDHFWAPKIYSYENARYEQDDIAGLDYRLRLGVGGGYQWLEKAKFESLGLLSFNQEAGVAWVKADYQNKDPDAEDSYASVRYAHHLDYTPKWYEGVAIFHNLEYMPQVDDWENYLMKADIGLTTKVFGDFDLLAKIEWDYNSRPSVGRKSSDTRYYVGLGYKW